MFSNRQDKQKSRQKYNVFDFIPNLKLKDARSVSL